MGIYSVDTGILVIRVVSYGANDSNCIYPRLQVPVNNVLAERVHYHVVRAVKQSTIVSIKLSYSATQSAAVIFLCFEAVDGFWQGW